MILKKCLLTRNDCYQKGQKITGGKPTGIVVHSTGANNPAIKRYVQPLKADDNYGEIMADLGKNQYNNHWNKSYKAKETTRQVCVHAFIGKNAAGEVETYQTLPFDICCWGCASGKNGSYNRNPTARVQFEICEDGLTNRNYFNAAFKEAIEFCAYLCKTYGFGVDKICSHREAYRAGYGNNHGDCDHWLKKFGLTMDWFRDEVRKQIGEKEDAEPKVKPEAKPSIPATQTDENGIQNGDSVFIAKGDVLQSFSPYRIRVTAKALNIRGGAGTDYAKAGIIKDRGVYTIVEECYDVDGAWGRLKSGAGWISLKYTKRM